MQEPIMQLKKLGPMPDSLEIEVTNEIIEKYENLLEEIVVPLTSEEVRILIGLFPTSTMYEVEWGLLHIIETYYEVNSTEYKALISECSSDEWRYVLEMRVRNAEK